MFVVHLGFIGFVLVDSPIVSDLTTTITQITSYSKSYNFTGVLFQLAIFLCCKTVQKMFNSILITSYNVFDKIALDPGLPV